MPDHIKEEKTAHRYPILPSEQEVDASLREEQQQLKPEYRSTLLELRQGNDYGSIAEKKGKTKEAEQMRGSRIKKQLRRTTPKQRSKKPKNQET
jgi:hypothetical protein